MAGVGSIFALVKRHSSIVAAVSFSTIDMVSAPKTALVNRPRSIWPYKSSMDATDGRIMLKMKYMLPPPPTRATKKHTHKQID